MRYLPMTAVALALTLGVVGSSYAEMDLYLHVDGLEGEAQEPGYEDWIEIDAFGIEFSRDFEPGPGGGLGPVDAGTFQFEKQMDSASPGLFQAAMTGNHFPAAELHIVRQDLAEPQLAASWEINNVFVTDYATSSSVGGEALDEFGFGYTALEYTYYQYDEYGDPLAFVASWDFLAQTFSADLDGDVDSFEFMTGTIPEPTSMVLLGSGAVMLLVRRRRS